MNTTSSPVKSSWRKALIIALSVIALLIAVAIIVDQMVLPAIVRQSDTIAVQNVVGEDFEAATQRLSDRGLQVMPPIEQFSTSIPEGKVMSQLPYAGAAVKPGRRIYLTVSKGIEKIKVPLLEGLTIRDARLSLLRSGLTMGNVEYIFSDSIQSDRVFRQSKAVGTAVASGTVIGITVSKGRSGVFVPDVVGLSMRDAEGVLLESGLKLGQITLMTSGTFSPNTVIRQFPEADSSASIGTAVHLTVVR